MNLPLPMVSALKAEQFLIPPQCRLLNCISKHFLIITSRINLILHPLKIKQSSGINVRL